jgi:5-methylcytosine-specific restriction endonuclease McrA
MTTSIRARVRTRAYLEVKYPACWDRASAIIRRRAGGHCERCGKKCHSLEVHHIGAPYIDGRSGNPHDKHDIRPENLIAICFACHDELEHVAAIRYKKHLQKKKRRARLARHRALGIGVGLVVYMGTEAAL